MIDITLPLVSTLPLWPGDPPFVWTAVSSMPEGAAYNNSKIELGVHCGTHIDAPNHYLADGPTVEALPLDVLIGPCRVLDLSHVDTLITAAVLEKYELAGCSRLLLKTRNSKLLHTGEFHRDYVALGECGARYLLEQGVKLVGIDYYSIAPYDDPETVHRLLLAKNVAILEAVDLASVAAGQYELICLPLLIPGADAAPVRTVLRGLLGT